MHAPRILMNSHPDGGSPGGAPSSGSGTPAAPAQGTGTAEPSMVEQLSKLIDAKLVEHRNGIFADLRKTGAFGKEKAPKTEANESTQAAPPASDDVQTIITRERAFNRAISSVKLTDTQFSRMERAFQLEKPDDPAAWVKAWVTDLGIGQAGGEQSPNPAPQRSGRPASDGSAPAPVVEPSEEMEPWRRSADDVRALVRRKGHVAAGNELRQQLRSSLNGRRIRLK